jgi:hypothetical protein
MEVCSNEITSHRDYYPPRYIVHEFPSDSQLENAIPKSESKKCFLNLKIPRCSKAPNLVATYRARLALFDKRDCCK